MSTSDLRLYELVLENGRSVSPYVWRIRYALAHKGLSYESAPMGFTDIPTTFGGTCKTLPVLRHGDRTIGDSWAIAEYLDAAFPDTRPLFTNATELAMVRFFDAWFIPTVMPRLFGLYVLDIHDAAQPRDQAYFRQTREARINGPTLEQFTADRESRIPAAREALAPLRTQLKSRPFLGGDTPNYADYIALGAFHWVASAATLPLLDKADDTLLHWLERGFELYGGIGRDPRMKPLFD